MNKWGGLNGDESTERRTNRVLYATQLVNKQEITRAKIELSGVGCTSYQHSGLLAATNAYFPCLNVS